MRWGGLMTAIALSMASCSDGSLGHQLEDALQRQPAELLESPADFRIGDGAPSSCGGPFTSWLMAFDPVESQRRWDRRIPFTADPPVVIDDVVITTASVMDDLPPGIVAVDADDGAPLWQRFVAEPYILDVERVDDHVRIGGKERVLDIGVDGAVLATEARDRSIGRDEPPPEWSADFDGHQLAVAGPDGAMLSVEVQVPDAAFDRVTFVEAERDHILVLIGSGVGPNAHAVVVDRAGTVVWTTHSVRNARLVGDLVVYDVRNPTMAGEGPTREVIAVSLLDGTVQWQTQAYAEFVRGLPGYVTNVDGVPVFLVNTDDHPAELVAVAGPDDVPVPLRPVESVTQDQRVVTGEGYVAVGVDAGLGIWSPEHGFVWEPTALPVRSVVPAGDHLIDVTGSELLGCG